MWHHIEAHKLRRAATADALVESLYQTEIVTCRTETCRSESKLELEGVFRDLGSSLPPSAVEKRSFFVAGL